MEVGSVGSGGKGNGWVEESGEGIGEAFVIKERGKKRRYRGRYKGEGGLEGRRWRKGNEGFVVSRCLK